MTTNSKTWYVYIIKTIDEKLYTGITTDVERRYKEHFTKGKQAKFFRSSPPEMLVFVCSQGSRSQASKLEAKIKKLKRQDKMMLITSSDNQLVQTNNESK